MSAEPSEVLRAAMTLSPADREDVALRLLESIDAPVDREEIAAAWDAEVARRIEDVRSGRARTLTWDQLRTKLDADSAARRG